MVDVVFDSNFFGLKNGSTTPVIKIWIIDFYFLLNQTPRYNGFKGFIKGMVDGLH